MTLAFMLGISTILGAYSTYLVYISPYTTAGDVVFLFLFITTPLAFSAYFLIFSSEIDQFLSSQSK